MRMRDRVSSLMSVFTMKSGCYQVRLSNGRLLASDVLYKKHPLFRMRGLLGRKQLLEGEGIFLAPCNSIHMFFMSFPIDAVFLGPEGRVLRIYESIQPWRMTRLVRGSRAVLEIQAGRCREYGVQEGTELCFIPLESNNPG